MEMWGLLKSCAFWFLFQLAKKKKIYIYIYYMGMFIIFSKSYINTQEENFSYETEAWLDPLKAKRLFF